MRRCSRRRAHQRALAVPRYSRRSAPRTASVDARLRPERERSLRIFRETARKAGTKASHVRAGFLASHGDWPPFDAASEVPTETCRPSMRLPWFPRKLAALRCGLRGSHGSLPPFDAASVVPVETCRPSMRLPWFPWRLAALRCGFRGSRGNLPPFDGASVVPTETCRPSMRLPWFPWRLAALRCGFRGSRGNFDSTLARGSPGRRSSAALGNESGWTQPAASCDFRADRAGPALADQPLKLSASGGGLEFEAWPGAV
jgi:hypothetical protein